MISKLNPISPVYKIPVSVLVVIYCAETAQALLIERADHPGFWQSVTGSLDTIEEALADACRREVFEETGIDRPLESFAALGVVNRYTIYPHWRARYAPGVTENVEHVFSLSVPLNTAITLNSDEHLHHQWLPFEQAAMSCFSWTNSQAIRAVADHIIGKHIGLHRAP